VLKNKVITTLLTIIISACAPVPTESVTIRNEVPSGNTNSQETASSGDKVITCMYVRLFDTPLYTRPSKGALEVTRVNSGVYPVIGLSKDGNFHRVVDLSSRAGDQYDVYYIKYWDLSNFELTTEWYFTYHERLPRPDICPKD
jgi:hypothetical protein